MDNNRRIGELRKNTLIIAISNIGSKAIAFILAPLYSYYLNVEQYGTMDLIVTTVGLLVPFFCLDIYEAVFRYANDDESSSGTILSTSIIVCIPGVVLAALIVAISFFYNKSTLENSFYIASFVILEALTNIVSQFLRGRRKMFEYAFGGVVNSLILLGSNIILLVILKYQLKGWLVSYLIAKLGTLLYLILSSDLLREFHVSNFDKDELHKYLKFSLPLMPTTIMWWVMNVSDRYMLQLMVGGVATGIYSAANKIPAILSVFETIFYQAWQTTAINSLNDKERDSFYSGVLDVYFCFLALGVLGLLVVGKPTMDLLFAKDYSQAWVCLPPLFIGVMIHALAGNLGSLYSVFINTKGALYSTVVGALTNILLNIVVIPKYGPLGAAYTTMIGYVVTLLYRWFDVKKFVYLKFESKKFLLYIGLMVFQALLFYNLDPVSYTIRIAIVLFAVFLERKTLIKMIRD